MVGQDLTDEFNALLESRQASIKVKDENMMDIVERLNDAIDRHFGKDPVLLKDAADEIERLRNMAIKDGERIYDLEKEVTQERNDYIIARLAHEGAMDRLEQKHKKEIERLREALETYRCGCPDGWEKTCTDRGCGYEARSALRQKDSE